MFEVVRGGGLDGRGERSDGEKHDSAVALMLDQCHNVEAKIPGQIRSVLNVQEMTARVLLVDTEALAVAQSSGDVLGANGIFMDALYTDVRAALAQWRAERGLPADPMAAFAASGYQDTINAERIGGTQSSWGA
jgi:L-rhamnose isomerase/sugar isomerase